MSTIYIDLDTVQENNNIILLNDEAWWHAFFGVLVFRRCLVLRHFYTLSKTLHWIVWARLSWSSVCPIVDNNKILKVLHIHYDHQRPTWPRGWKFHIFCTNFFAHYYYLLTFHNYVSFLHKLLQTKFGQNNPGCFEKEAENKIFQMLTDDARWRTKTDTYVGNIGVWWHTYLLIKEVYGALKNRSL